MDGLGARAPGRVEDLLDAQVVLGGRAVAEVVGLVGARDVQRRRGRARSRRPRSRRPAPQRTHDAHRDLAAIGDQYLAEHRRRKLSVPPPRRPSGGSRSGGRDQPGADGPRWLASSIRMKLPVRRLLVYASNASGTFVRRRTRPMSLSVSCSAALVRCKRVHVDDGLSIDRDRAGVSRGLLQRIARAGPQRALAHPADVGLAARARPSQPPSGGRSARRARRRARPPGAASATSARSPPRARRRRCRSRRSACAAPLGQRRRPPRRAAVRRWRAGPA